MNNSMIRLKGRGYLIGNLSLLSLLFLSLCAFSVCVNILPEAITQLLSEHSVKTRAFAVAGVSLGVIVLMAFIFSISYLGVQRFFLRKAERKGGKVKDIFFYFLPSESFQAFGFVCRYLLMKLFIYTVCYLPFLLGMGFMLRLLKSTASLSITLLMLFTVILLFINGSVFALSVRHSLFLVKYYYINGSCISFGQLVANSQREMKKHRKSLLSLELSFVWWFLSCILVFPLVYVFLYYGQSKAVFAAEIMNE